MNKKRIFVFFIIFIFAFTIISQEEDLAKYYLKASFNFYMDGKAESAKINLEKGYGFNKNLPECYYISNLLLPDIKDNIALKKKNADLIIKYLKNSFFIEDYNFYKQISSIFETVKDFNKSIFYYDKLISVFNRVQEEDFNNYLKMLLKTNDKTKYNLIPSVVLKAKERYDSLDFDYYLLLYKIFSSNINYNEFIRIIGLLEANNYSKSRLLYLKIIYYQSSNILNALYNEYIALRDKKDIEPEYLERILFGLLSKSYYFSNNKLIELLYDWDKNAQNNLKTLQLINNKRVLSLINSIQDLKTKYLNYNGIRVRDEDENENWEEAYEFKNGLIINKIFDNNQDGIYEIMITYFNDGKVNEYFVYGENNNNFKKFYLNDKDQSLKFIEYYLDNKLVKRVALLESLYKPEIVSLKNIDYKSILNYVAYIEEWDKEYTKINYYNSSIKDRYIDTDNNGKFDKKVFLKNGITDVIYRDVNEDGIYELFEKYNNGVLIYINYMTDQSNGIYDYREEYYSNKTIKYWDYDKDNIFEVAVEEFNNGIIRKMFDVNYNSKYDYVYEEKNGVLNRIYKVDENSQKIKKEILIKDGKYSVLKSKNKNWIIVTVKNPDLVMIPDKIIINDAVKLSGIYYYNNKRSYFQNSIIENENFSYKIFLLDNMIYLIDLN